MTAFQKADFLDIPLGKLTKTLLGSQDWRFNKGITVFRKQNCSLLFSVANDTVELSLSKSIIVTTNIDPTTLDELVVDDVMIL